MKLTILGLTLSSAWGNGHATPLRAMARALHRRGHEISFYERDVPYYALRRDFSSCGYCALTLYPDWNAVRGQALCEAAASDAVIVTSYCPEGARVADEVLALAGPLRVFYDLDTAPTLARLAEGDLEYLRRDQIPGFDLYLSWVGGPTLHELETRWGARRACPLYGCVDPDDYRRVPPRPEFECALSYMGTYAPDRQQTLDALFLEPSRRLQRERFVLAGSMYPRGWSWGENIRRFDHVAPADHPALYSSSRATLNITRAAMARAGWCPSGRFFEAAACGTPIITDWFEGLDHFFDVRDELFVARNAEDAIAALQAPGQELAAVAARARQRCLDEHTGAARATALLAALGATSVRPPLRASTPFAAAGEIS